MAPTLTLIISPNIGFWGGKEPNNYDWQRNNSGGGGIFSQSYRDGTNSLTKYHPILWPKKAQKLDPDIQPVLKSKEQSDRPDWQIVESHSSFTKLYWAQWKSLRLQEGVLHRPCRSANDILGPLPLSETGNRYLLLVADYFTKWPEAYSLRSNNS